MRLDELTRGDFPILNRRSLGVVGTTRASFSVYTSPEEVELLARTLPGIRDAL